MNVIHQSRAALRYGRRPLLAAGAPVSERTLVTQALEKVASCIARAKLYLGEHKSKASSSPEKAVIRKWFGNASVQACTSLYKRYSDMLSVYSRNVYVWRFTGNVGNPRVLPGLQEAATFYAQVESRGGMQVSNKSVDIEFGDPFFVPQPAAERASSGIPDAQLRAGTIIHETSHRLWVVQGTGLSAVLSDDFAYAYDDCRRLAQHKAHYARANADNIMYFALEFFDGATPVVPPDELATCKYFRLPNANGLAGDLRELNYNRHVHLDPIAGD